MGGAAGGGPALSGRRQGRFSGNFAQRERDFSRRAAWLGALANLLDSAPTCSPRSTLAVLCSNKARTAYFSQHPHCARKVSCAQFVHTLVKVLAHARRGLPNAIDAPRPSCTHAGRPKRRHPRASHALRCAERVEPESRHGAIRRDCTHDPLREGQHHLHSMHLGRHQRTRPEGKRLLTGRPTQSALPQTRSH